MSIVSASSSAIRMLSAGSAADLALACMAAKSATTLLYECCVACGRQKWLPGAGSSRFALGWIVDEIRQRERFAIRHVGASVQPLLDRLLGDLESCRQFFQPQSSGGVFEQAFFRVIGHGVYSGRGRPLKEKSGHIKLLRRCTTRWQAELSSGSVSVTGGQYRAMNALLRTMRGWLRLIVTHEARVII